MTEAERNALVERMTDAAADAYMDNECITFTAAMRAAIRAALAVAEPVVREDEREACAQIADMATKSGLAAAKQHARNIATRIRARGAA